MFQQSRGREEILLLPQWCMSTLNGVKLPLTIQYACLPTTATKHPLKGAPCMLWVFLEDEFQLLRVKGRRQAPIGKSNMTVANYQQVWSTSPAHIQTCKQSSKSKPQYSGAPTGQESLKTQVLSVLLQENRTLASHKSPLFYSSGMMQNLRILLLPPLHSKSKSECAHV